MVPKHSSETPQARAFEPFDAQDAIFEDDEMSRLMDLLASLRMDLTTGVLPRAARLTGTLDRLAAAAGCVEAAIGIARRAMMRSREGGGSLGVSQMRE